MITDERQSAAFVRLVDEVTRLRGRLRELFGPIYDAVGMSDVEMAVFNAVLGAPLPPTVPRIGRSLGHPRQVVQRAVNILSERGLIATAPNPDHKRAALLAPTSAGRALKARADDLAAQAAAPLLSGLEAKDLNDAAEILHRLRAAIEAGRRQAPAQEAQP